jgi:hypothetical protein
LLHAKSVVLVPGFGSSNFDVCITKLVDGLVNVVLAEEYRRPHFNAMIQTTVKMLTELAFVLELLKELGEAQKELGIEKEASYIITVINPKIPKREEFLPTTEEAPKYPESVLNDFSTDENFVPLSRNLRFIDSHFKFYFQC